MHLVARQGDVLSCYSLNQHQAPNESTITVVCERGTARFEYHRSRWRWMESPDEAWRDETIEALQRDSLFVAQANAFLDTLEGRRPPLCSLDEALQTLLVNLAALDSAALPAWTRID